MKSIFLKIVLVIVLAGLLNRSFAQHDNTLYFMENIPQSNLANPAHGYNCNVNIYGLLVPVFGQFPPPMSINMGNTGFTLKHAFRKGGIVVLEPDTNSAYTPKTADLRDSLIPDADYLLKAMRPYNYLTTDFQVHLLGVGFKIKEWSFTFGVTEKLNMNIKYPRDFFGLIWKGNGNYIDKPADVSFGLNFAHYREYLFGAQIKLLDKLKVGANAKLLFGKSNIYTRHSDIKLYTDENTFDLTVASDVEINMSLPDSVLIDYKDGTGNNGIVYSDSVKFEMEAGDFSASKYLLQRRNPGVALDLGAIYELNDEINLYASIIDLGFIRWKNNTYTFKQNGEFTYSGLDLNKWLDTVHYNTSDLSKALGDSIYRAFQVTSHNKPYSSYLQTKIYIGGTYKLNKMIDFGLLTRTEIYHRSLHPSFTLSCNTNFTKWFTASASYSMINRFWMNLGLGFGIKAGFSQFYIVSDNLFGYRPEMSSGIMMPYNTRTMNMRFGWNLIFGCPKKLAAGKSFL